MRKRYETVIYDLDGTLLNTLEDLANAVNHAMRESGYPERTLEEVCRFVGNGVGQLIHRALPASADGDEEAFEETLQAFKSYYARHNNDTTAPYDGIEALLERLNQAGVRQAIVSNKNDPNVKALTQDYFSRWIPLAVGEQEGVRRKPAPDTVLRVMKEWGMQAIRSALCRRQRRGCGNRPQCRSGRCSGLLGVPHRGRAARRRRYEPVPYA